MTSDVPVFVVYGFELLVRVWFVSIVLDFVGPTFFGCVSSTNPLVPLYYWPKWPMMGVHV